MKRIEEIDRNFKIETNIDCESLRFYNAESEPFRIYGLMRENDRFCRLPERVAKEVSEGVHSLYANTAGGRIRFVTDSPYIAISAQMDRIGKMSHFALTGSGGFDLYVDEGQGQMYCRSFVPPYGMKTGYESLARIPGKRMERLITINFPLYSDVKELCIGLAENAVLKRAPDYTYEKPIVYYGSSITQGGCASRPGNAYQAIISRLLDCNFINLGFSGGAKGEKEMVQYIASLDMRVFVMDYDYNAPTVEHLAATHEPMYASIRKANPTLPIILLSRPRVRLVEEEKERLAVIQKTYDKALQSGDQNIYFLSGKEMLNSCVEEIATVDGCHPNDSGFMSMAYSLSKLLSEI